MGQDISSFVRTSSSGEPELNTWRLCCVRMLSSFRPKASRNRVDTSTRDLARRWRKRLDKSTEEIEAAVAKVRNNAETVIKELELRDRDHVANADLV